MKILVTGGAGFIGSNLVDGFLAAGHEVVVVDNLSSGKRQNLNAGARFYELDIGDPGLGEVFARERFDLVNHHAAQIDVRHSVTDPQSDARTNILGLLNIMENCRRHGVRGVVFASSGGVVYGEPSRLPATETFPKGPLSPYGVSKLASEFYLCYYAQVMGIPYVTLRYGNVYGPRQDPHGEAGVVAIFGEKLLRGETPVIYGDGEQLRDYVFVGDVVRANLLAIGAPGRGCLRRRSGRLRHQRLRLQHRHRPVAPRSTSCLPFSRRSPGSRGRPSMARRERGSCGGSTWTPPGHSRSWAGRRRSPSGRACAAPWSTWPASSHRLPIQLVLGFSGGLSYPH